MRISAVCHLGLSTFCIFVWGSFSPSAVAETATPGSPVEPNLQVPNGDTIAYGALMQEARFREVIADAEKKIAQARLREAEDLLDQCRRLRVRGAASELEFRTHTRDAEVAKVEIDSWTKKMEEARLDYHFHELRRIGATVGKEDVYAMAQTVADRSKIRLALVQNAIVKSQSELVLASYRYRITTALRDRNAEAQEEMIKQRYLSEKARIEVGKHEQLLGEAENVLEQDLKTLREAKLAQDASPPSKS